MINTHTHHVTNVQRKKYLTREGRFFHNDKYMVSAHIPVSENDIVTAPTGQKLRFVTAYRDDGTVSWTQGSNNFLTSYVVPAGIASVRVTTLCSYGTIATVIVPTAQELIEASKYYNAKWTIFGDSNTAMFKWQRPIRDKYSLDVTNLGVGGRKITGSLGMARQTQIDTLNTDAEFLTIMGGTNDMSQNTPIATYEADYNLLLARAKLRAPNAEINVLGQLYGYWVDFATRGWPDGETNALGLKREDYAAAAQRAAIAAGVDYYDLGANAGIDATNALTFMQSPTDLIHLNDNVGGPRVSYVLLRDVYTV